jgi:MscS family membrane protein
MQDEIERMASESSVWLDNYISNQWIVAAIVVLIGLMVAKAAEILIVSVVAQLLEKTENKLDEQVVLMLHRPLFTTFSLVGLMIASYILVDDIGEPGQEIVLAILKTIIIFSWLSFFMRILGAVLSSMVRHRTRFVFAQRDTAPLIRNLAIVLLILAGAYSILVAWNINVTGLVASAGIVGLALSFAAQDTLSHLFAGVAILADRPYRIGDFIVLDTGERGMVTTIGLRSTQLMTRDDVEVSIPNGVMGSAKIVNESGGTKSHFRIRAAVGVAYGSDVEKALNVLERIALANEGLCDEPKPRARFRAFGTSSLDFELLAWISDPSERGLRVHELNCEIYRRFAEEKIVIPFPQQDVWIKELPSADKQQDDAAD